MAFLAGALSPMLTAATQVGGDVAGAQVKAAELKQQMMIAAMNMRREQQLADIKQLLAQTQGPLNQARTSEALRNAAAPVQYSPAAIAGAGAQAGAEAQAKLGPELQLAIANHTLSKDEAVAIQNMRSSSAQSIAGQEIGARATEGAANRAATAGNVAATTAGGMARVKQTQAGSLTGRILGVPGPSAPASGKPVLTQAQYDAGIAKGHTPDEIAQHYDISQVQVQPVASPPPTTP